MGMRLLLTVIFLIISFGSFSQSLRVGVYSNPPLIEVDSAGKASGFTIE